ncbi:MAG TPA: ion transporter [Kiloniellaceae bacterium]|nr:ion transporter [Kiloniellaceae bacterium]
MQQIRRWLYVNLFPGAWHKRGLSPVNRAVFFLVLFSVVVVVFETEQTISQPLAPLFRTFNFIIALLFTIEYLARLWAAGCIPEYRGLRGRIRYVFTLWSLFDLLAIVPYYLSPLLANFGISGSEAFLIRLARLLRIVSIARIGRYGEALKLLGHSVWERRHELIVTVALTAFLLLVASTTMYLCEREAQPEAFGSIIRALWWGLITLTTIGYGDVYPLTALGKITAGIFAFAAIGLIAMPTGILAAAFSDAFQRRRGRETATQAKAAQERPARGTPP